MLYRKVWIWWGVFCPPPQTLLARRLHCQRENHSQVKGVAQKQKLINMRKLMLKTAIFIAVLTASLAVFAAPTIVISDGVVTSGPITGAGGFVRYENDSFNASWQVVI